MGYSKHTWQSGEMITAAKMNNIENGIANGIPVPTASDDGCALVVQKKNVPGAVIVPEQIVTLYDNAGGTLVNVNTSLFVPDTKFIMVVNNEWFEGTTYEEDEVFVVAEADGKYIVFEGDYTPGNNVNFYPGLDGTYTVSLYVAEEEYGYVFKPVQMEVKIVNQSTGQCDKTWQEVVDAMKSGIRVFFNAPVLNNIYYVMTAHYYVVGGNDSAYGIGFLSYETNGEVRYFWLISRTNDSYLYFED